jgi:hypothetical protein
MCVVGRGWESVFWREAGIGISSISDAMSARTLVMGRLGDKGDAQCGLPSSVCGEANQYPGEIDKAGEEAMKTVESVQCVH